MDPEVTENGNTKICVIGTRMLEGTLDQYVKDLTAAISDDKVPIQYVDVESEKGARLTELLDIEEGRLPAILILEDDETTYKDWYGEDLPRVEDVAYELGQLTGNESGE